MAETHSYNITLVIISLPRRSQAIDVAATPHHHTSIYAYNFGAVILSRLPTIYIKRDERMHWLWRQHNTTVRQINGCCCFLCVMAGAAAWPGVCTTRGVCFTVGIEPQQVTDREARTSLLFATCRGWLVCLLFAVAPTTMRKVSLLYFGRRN